MEQCANCGRNIGQLETAELWQDNVVCAECRKRLAGTGGGRRLGVVIGAIVAVAAVAVVVAMLSGGGKRSIAAAENANQTSPRPEMSELLTQESLAEVVAAAQSFDSDVVTEALRRRFGQKRVQYFGFDYVVTEAKPRGATFEVTLETTSPLVSKKIGGRVLIEPDLVYSLSPAEMQRASLIRTGQATRFEGVFERAFVYVADSGPVRITLYFSDSTIK